MRVQGRIVAVPAPRVADGEGMKRFNEMGSEERILFILEEWNGWIVIVCLAVLLALSIFAISEYDAVDDHVLNPNTSFSFVSKPTRIENFGGFFVWNIWFLVYAGIAGTVVAIALFFLTWLAVSIFPSWKSLLITLGVFALIIALKYALWRIAV